MQDKEIISVINNLLHEAAERLAVWLNRMLPPVSKNWWQECVLNNLADSQLRVVQERSYTKLEQLDLAMLLRVANKAWYEMSTRAVIPIKDRQIVREMIGVRNNWAHVSVDIPAKETIIDDACTIKDFFNNVIKTEYYDEPIQAFLELLTDNDDYDYDLYDDNFEDLGELEDLDIAGESDEKVEAEPVVDNSSEIHEKDRVFLVGDPDTKGMVFSVSEINRKKKYEVFVNGDIKTFYEGQIVKIDDKPKYKWVDINTFQSNLTAYEVNNPSAGNLYSLNSARIDFVPYQFRPALKLIKSDDPRILIADSVGVGKTIEAGLIIKELEARNELDNILIICPKPLVSEQKWENEMKRFDEDFVSLDGPTLRQIISNTDRDGEWPSRYNKAIIPYSILDSEVFNGNTQKRRKTIGLKQLDPAPHFDLVIIDEAHHLRNGSLEKEKAFAYKCCHYFCKHASAVVMLTATPLQTSDDDLFTLLNLLRPDVIIDKSTFNLMARPNEFIYNASHVVRSAVDGWEKIASAELKNILSTQWGENVVSKNPLFNDILRRLDEKIISRNERVKLITDIESLHSFNTMLNRTRRRDIQDFCIRRSFTVETSFTPVQYRLHTELLRFEYEALAKLYHVRSIPFMMSTIRRQAASCIFGLAPHIRSIIGRRFGQISDDGEIEFEEIDGDAVTTLKGLAEHILKLADNLPDDDPKFDSVMRIIEEKNRNDNNKIILFSTFKHTLAYLFEKFKKAGLRVAQIDGSVKDEMRRELRERFMLPKVDSNAIDLLLFTEVGSEGLDYQFCDTMINYDLPWNPMRIEQRIGRIDRRGQQAEAVNIYNVLTSDTVDADIYKRCLLRIGVFERSIGECEEVLGEIGTQIESLAMDTSLTDDERRQKLKLMADNEVRKLQELEKLEDEEHALFGFDLSSYTASQEIKDAESPWVSPMGIQRLIERYFNERLGNGQYILGNGDLKVLRLSKDARNTLREDFKKLSNIKSALKRKWDNYLKGTEPLHKLTFLPEEASRDSKAFFITPVHPLVKQAASFFATNEKSYVHLEYHTDTLPTGRYPFSVYAWSYVGINPQFRVVTVCNNDIVANELTDILQIPDLTTSVINIDKNPWGELESKHIQLWEQEKEKYLQIVKVTANYKLESIGGNYRNRKRSLEQKMMDAVEDGIRKLYEGELNNATEAYQRKVEEITEKISRADIHTVLIANGILDIKE